MAKALTKEGGKPVMRTTDLQRGVDEALSKLGSLKTPDAEQAAKAVKELADDLAQRTKPDPLTGKGGDLTAADIVKFESDMWEIDQAWREGR